MKIITKLSLLALICSTVSACMPNISADQIQAGNANQVTATVAGKIISMQPMTVNGDSDNKIGMLSGAAIGGVAGSAIGGGTRAPIIGAIGGALLGGMAGNAIQNKVSTQQGMQYTIKLPGGRLLTVVQGLSPAYGIGQCVLLVEGEHARITGSADPSVCTTAPVRTRHNPVAIQQIIVNS